MIIILQVSSPDIVTVLEGILSFLFFPLLVFLAFAADKGWFSSAEDRADCLTSRVLAAEMTKEELAEMAAKIRRSHGPDLSDEQVMKMIQTETAQPKSRAQYRVEATRKQFAMHRVSIYEAEQEARRRSVQRLEAGDTA